MGAKVVDRRRMRLKVSERAMAAVFVMLMMKEGRCEQERESVK